MKLEPLVLDEQHAPDSLWSVADAWFDAKGLQAEFRHLVNATQIEGFYGGLGNLLDEIRRPASISLLNTWKHASPAAEALFRLAVAANAPSGIPPEFSAYSDTRSARSHLGKSLKRCYLLALFITHYPDGSPDTAWLAQLRLWLLTHAYQRSLNDSVLLDQHHRKVADALRICCEEISRGITNAWAEVFYGLLCSSNDWSALNSSIRGLANHHREKKTFSDSGQDLLRAITAITTAEALSIDDASAAFRWTIPPQQRGNENGSEQALIEDDDEIDLPNNIFVGGTDQDGDFIGVDIPKDISSSQELHLERSVLLYSSEEQQHLPWSWSRPNPYETATLKCWLQTENTSESFENRLAQALIWIAATFGRSLRRTLAISIGTDSQDEWQLHPDGRFHRRPPSRYAGWRPASDEERRWVHPSLTHIEIIPPAHIAATLVEALGRSPTSTILSGLWTATDSQLKVESLCATKLSEISPRLTPGMLAGVLPLQSYLAQRNHTFARLISSHPASGLPGACGYGYWDAEETQRVFQVTSDTCPDHLSTDDLRARALGSQLCPIESLLVSSLNNAARTVSQLRELDDPIRFHNAFSALAVVMLLAATGARPIRDPFESLRFFDFVERFVYIEDKVFDGIHQGRLALLPSAVCKFLRESYLPHLTYLANGLMPSAPLLAKEIALLTISPSGKLPFFFFLGTDADGLQWRSVSESEITGLGLFDWPLPLNLFRHRLSRELRILGLDPELIDAILGHAEAGSLTHSDYGLRIWEEDMVLARPSIEAAFGALRIPFIKGWEAPPVIDITKETDRPRSVYFGIRARAEQRHAHVRSAIGDAKRIVRKFLDGRKLDEFTPDEIDTLTKQLLLNQSGLPHPNGHLRYRYLLRLIDRNWHLRSKRIQVRRRYFRPDESTPFTSTAPGSKAVLGALRIQLANLATTQTRRPTQLISISLGILHLCLESRIADPALLMDILKGSNFRAVNLDQKPYLEYAAGLTRHQSNAAVRRFPLTWKSAQYLHTALTAKSKAKKTPCEESNGKTPEHSTVLLPEILAPIALEAARHLSTPAATSMRQLIEALCRIVDQCNACQFPGVIVAYLGGRLKYSSLAWHDWARLVTERQLELVSEAQLQPRENAPAAGASGSLPSTHGTALEHQKAAKELFSDIQTLLLKNPQANARTSERRQKIAQNCAELIKAKEGYVGPTILLAAWWIQAHIFTGRTRERQTLTSIARYLVALAPGFQETAYDLDLLELDEDGITAFYCDFMEARHVENKAVVAEQLMSFHRYAHAEYGIANPDWAELPEFSTVTPSAPSVISEMEYQEALRQLFNQLDTSARLRCARSLALLCCYRFALRPGESWGLLRKDWVQAGENIVVLIRDNRHRTIKTRAGRRQVPLLFPLSPLEKQIIEQWRLELESQFGSDDRCPLFFDSANPAQPIEREQLLRPIQHTLKRVTGNPNASLHDARHSTISRLGLSLGKLEFSAWASFFAESNNPDIEMQLLGTRGITRRKSWVLARYAGHAHPSTTFANYIHHLDFWLEQLLDLDIGNPPKVKPAQIIDLDSFGTREQAQTFAPLIHDQNCTPTQILKFARLLARGQDMARAASAQDIPLTIAEEVQGLLKILSQRGKYSRTAMGEGPQGNRRPLEFIQRIRDNAWKRILDFAHGSVMATAPALASLPTEEFSGMLSNRWHLVIWQAHQFIAARELAEQLAIHDEQHCFRMLATISCKPDLLTAARNNKFEPETIDTAIGKGAQGQLGTVELPGQGNRFDQRCALVYLENGFCPLRNGMEFFLMAIAYWAASKSRQPSKAA